MTQTRPAHVASGTSSKRLRRQRTPRHVKAAHVLDDIAAVKNAAVACICGVATSLLLQPAALAHGQSAWSDPVRATTQSSVELVSLADNARAFLFPDAEDNDLTPEEPTLPEVPKTMPPQPEPEDDFAVPQAPNPSLPGPNVEPPRTPSEPPAAVDPDGPFPADPLPPSRPEGPPQFLVQQDRSAVVASSSSSSAASDHMQTPAVSPLLYRAIAQPHATLAALPGPRDFAPALARTVSDVETWGDAEAPDSFASPLPPDFTYPELKQLPRLNYTLRTLKNGLQLYLIPDSNAPLIQAAMLFPGGAYASPDDQVLLANTAVVLQRAGGTVNFPGPQLDMQLEDIAADIVGATYPQVFTLSFECLEQDLPFVLDTVRDMLQNPVLPEAELQLLKAQQLNGVAHRNDSKAGVANRIMKEIVFGPNSMLSRQPTSEGITAMTSESCESWLHTWQRPDAARLIVLGNFVIEEVETMLNSHLGEWVVSPGQPKAPPPVPRGSDPQGPTEPAIYLVDRPGVDQAAVLVAEPGVTLLDDDSYALDIVASAMNGFGGLLFDVVRSREGLAYNISAGWDTPPTHIGLFTASAETAQPAALLSLMRTVFEQLVTSPLPEDVIAREKEQRLNSFVFRFASKADRAQRLVAYDIYGLPQDFLFKYQKGVQSVTSASAWRAARRHLHPEQQVVVVVGDASKFQAELEATGLPVKLVAL